MPHLHWDGDVTRNYTAYNFQTLRDEVYMLARDGDVTTATASARPAPTVAPIPRRLLQRQS